mmetsp:Transcript_13808/g.34817  ORF Transcript_13808/g.34817 Transcript_13808/m.34817 type:complete len:251 (+) Transcript_13808:6561-7313(+)
MHCKERHFVFMNENQLAARQGCTSRHDNVGADKGLASSKIGHGVAHSIRCGCCVPHSGVPVVRAASLGCGRHAALDTPHRQHVRVAAISFARRGERSRCSCAIGRITRDGIVRNRLLVVHCCARANGVEHSWRRPAHNRHASLSTRDHTGGSALDFEGSRATHNPSCGVANITRVHVLLGENEVAVSVLSIGHRRNRATLHRDTRHHTRQLFVRFARRNVAVCSGSAAVHGIPSVTSVGDLILVLHRNIS